MKYKCWDKDLIGYKNNSTFMIYFDYLSNLVMTRYEWINLPESMNERFLELVLFEDGQAVLVNDPFYGFLNLRYTESADLNIYQEPEKIEAYSLDYHENYKLSDVSLVYNNPNKTPDISIVYEYALRLYEIRRTIDVNTKNQKTPLLITCPDNKRLSLKNLYMKYDGNEPIIYGYKDSFNDTEFKVLKTDAPFISNDLQLLFNSIFNEFLTRYGINNANTDKKERLITDEVQSNIQQVKMSSDIGLIYRKKACDLFNKKYGTDIDVKFRTPIITEESGDKVNEQIYDRT